MNIRGMTVAGADLIIENDKVTVVMALHDDQRTDDEILDDVELELKRLGYAYKVNTIH